jgi:glycosyltransferase involved in cell wall biosynthesis
VGGNPEIVSEDCGFIVPPRDPHRLAEKLLLVLKDQQLRGRLEEASRKRALSHFDWDVITKEWVRSYEALG